MVGCYHRWSDCHLFQPAKPILPNTTPKPTAAIATTRTTLIAIHNSIIILSLLNVGIGRCILTEHCCIFLFTSQHILYWEHVAVAVNPKFYYFYLGRILNMKTVPTPITKPKPTQPTTATIISLISTSIVPLCLMFELVGAFS